VCFLAVRVELVLIDAVRLVFWDGEAEGEGHKGGEDGNDIGMHRVLFEAKEAACEAVG